MLFLLLIFHSGLCVAGLTLVLFIKPGLAHAVSSGEGVDEEASSTADALMDVVR